ncbi:hypothetical protein DdX_20332 [Ditylenchus destructor]|uniref:Uncharacterized protein n=1 Tax=Ditylenchus destructor TaxID=166010 RepID=A0AAD4MHD2_9BILA|nr:hypothetical protein DdX_20332 [Ditylenchus destructor]
MFNTSFIQARGAPQRIYSKSGRVHHYPRINSHLYHHLMANPENTLESTSLYQEDTFPVSRPQNNDPGDGQLNQTLSTISKILVPLEEAYSELISSTEAWKESRTPILKTRVVGPTLRRRSASTPTAGVEAQLYLWPVIRDFLINRAWHTAVTLSQCSNCSHNPSHCAGAACQAPVFIFNGKKPRRYVDGANSEIPGDIEMQPIPRTVRTRVPAPCLIRAKPKCPTRATTHSDAKRPKWNFLSRECREPRTK